MPSLARLYRLRSTPALPSMASRSALKKPRFLSAAPTGQPAFCKTVHAIPGAGALTPTGPGLAIHGKSFGPQEAALLVGCADRAACILQDCACHPWRGCIGSDWPRPCHPWQVVRPSRSCASCRLRRPGLTQPPGREWSVPRRRSSWATCGGSLPTAGRPRSTSRRPPARLRR